jgi:hypothetical protein
VAQRSFSPSRAVAADGYREAIADSAPLLAGYPKVKLPDATSLLYWQETEFGLKPTIRISHLTIRTSPEDTVVASKMAALSSTLAERR